MLRSTIGSLLVCFLALFAVTAHAQTSLYVVGGLANYGFSDLSTQPVSAKPDTGGFGAGVFHNFPIESRVTVGLDGRVEGSPGYRGGVLGGVALRVGFVPNRNPLRPYFQIGAGVVHSSYNQTFGYSDGFSSYTSVVSESVTSGAAQFVLGLDIRLNDHLDLRAPELGSEAGGGSGVHAVSSFLNAGLVYHLRSKHRR